MGLKEGLRSSALNFSTVVPHSAIRSVAEWSLRVILYLFLYAVESLVEHPGAVVADAVNKLVAGIERV
jgi:hypothetical protein